MRTHLLKPPRRLQPTLRICHANCLVARVFDWVASPRFVRERTQESPMSSRAMLCVLTHQPDHVQNDDMQAARDTRVRRMRATSKEQRSTPSASFPSDAADVTSACGCQESTTQAHIGNQTPAMHYPLACCRSDTTRPLRSCVPWSRRLRCNTQRPNRTSCIGQSASREKHAQTS